MVLWMRRDGRWLDNATGILLLWRELSLLVVSIRGLPDRLWLGWGRLRRVIIVISRRLRRPLLLLLLWVCLLLLLLLLLLQVVELVFELDTLLVAHGRVVVCGRGTDHGQAGRR